MVQSSSDWSCAITFDYCELADWLGTTVDNLRGNKFAELYAKEAVAIQKLSLPKIDDKNWQLWFAKVNARLGATQPEKKKQDPPASENTKTKKALYRMGFVPSIPLRTLNLGFQSGIGPPWLSSLHGPPNVRTYLFHIQV